MTIMSSTLKSHLTTTSASCPTRSRAWTSPRPLSAISISGVIVKENPCVPTVTSGTLLYNVRKCYFTDACSCSSSLILTILPRGDRTVVCKHWLRGLCKKGDDCEFLHEYDMSKMPECYFYQKFGTCLNKECPFQHIDPAAKIKDCPWYDRGFCRHGPSCRHRHTRRVLCINYLVGFCPDGKAELN